MAVERFTLQLHDKNDADIVAYLNRQENKNGAMKRALRAQIEVERRVLLARMEADE